MAGGKRTAADPGAWLIFEDESGQGLRPPKGRTWGRRGDTPVVTVTGAQRARVPGRADRRQARVPAPAHLPCSPRPRPWQGPAQGLHQGGLRGPAGRAHQQLGGPLVVAWDNLNTPVSAALAVQPGHPAVLALRQGE